MAEGSSRNAGRWMRSKAEEGTQGRGDREEKGKGIMERDTEKVFIPVSDDSENESDEFDADKEKGEPVNERFEGIGK